MAFDIRRGTHDDIATIVRFNCSLARETEGIELNPLTVQAGVLAVMEDPSKGFYLIADVPAGTAASDPLSEMMLMDATFSASGGHGRESLPGDVVPGGQILVTYEWSDWRCGDFWWIQSVWVEPEYRRQGVLTALFGHVRAEASKRVDVSGLRLYTVPGNKAAQAAYANLGLRSGRYLLYESEPESPGG